MPSAKQTPTVRKVRNLSAEDLRLRSEREIGPSGEGEFEEPGINDKDPLYVDLQQLFSDGFGGVILVGPPGTGKSWYARQIAALIAGRQRHRARFVQFHPSYQYEDFVEAYEPQQNGSFALEPRHFRLICEKAVNDPDADYVLVIDELSRCDAVRVFGEALTYVEGALRGIPFVLSSGTEMVVPPNLRIIATMNPWDRGVDEIDLAFERRFAKVALEPDATALRSMLKRNKCSATVIEAVVAFFGDIQKLPETYTRIGHAYFRGVRDAASMQRLWNNQLRFHFERTLQMEPESLDRARKSWARTQETLSGKEPPAAAVGGPQE